MSSIVGRVIYALRSAVDHGPVQNRYLSIDIHILHAFVLMSTIKFTSAAAFMLTVAWQWATIHQCWPLSWMWMKWQGTPKHKLHPKFTSPVILPMIPLCEEGPTWTAQWVFSCDSGDQTIVSSLRPDNYCVCSSFDQIVFFKTKLKQPGLQINSRLMILIWQLQKPFPIGLFWFQCMSFDLWEGYCFCSV